MDAVALGMAKADARKRYAHGDATVAWLGDSLTANGSSSGSNTGQYVGTLGASVAVGATSISVLYAHTAANGFNNVTPPGTNVAYVLEPGTPREEWLSPSAVTGTGPYVLTVPALQFAHSAGSHIRNVPRAYNAVSVPMWAALLSSNRVRFGGVYAHGGYTTAQIESIYLPQVLALDPKPWAVVMNVGTNDSYSLTAALPDALRIIDSLLNAGIRPIVTSAPPSGSTTPIVSETVPRMKWNDALSAHCALRGVQFVDIMTPLVDPATGGSKPMLAADNTHPGPVGAKVWAQAVVDAITPNLPHPIAPMMPARNVVATDTTTYPFNVNNALLMNDANADGIPDGWLEVLAAPNVTPSLVVEPGVPGKMFRVSRAAAATGASRHGAVGIPLVPGARYRAHLRIKTSGVDVAYDSVTTTVNGITNSSFPGFSVRLIQDNQDVHFSLVNWKRDIALTLVSFDFVAPKRSGSTVQWTVVTEGGSSIPAYTVQVQPWLVNLTALGL